jgi:hypothetical protein
MNDLYTIAIIFKSWNLFIDNKFDYSLREITHDLLFFYYFDILALTACNAS